MDLRRAVAAGIAAVAVLSSGAASAASAASPRDAALTRSIRQALRTANAPGAIVGVWASTGKPAYVGTFGVRDTQATGRPMRRDLHMRIGSVAKTFTVTALLQLVDQGKVSLDDPISKYIDGVIAGDRITLRELATMRSGLVNYTVTEPFDEALTANPYRCRQAAAAAGLLDWRPASSSSRARRFQLLRHEHDPARAPCRSEKV